MGAETHRGSGRTVEQAANADRADCGRTVDRWGPIVELHVHLEGSMRPDTIRELADANGVDLPAALSAGRWSFQDFDDFMVQYGLACRCLRRPEDFYRVAVEFIDDVADAGTRYVEVTFTPGGHGRRVGDWEWPLESMLAGLADRGGQRGVIARVILDHSREQPLEMAMRTAELAVAYRERGVVGLGLGGDERHTPATFAPAFALARDHGLASIVHAGEFSDSDSVWGAIDSLGATRIGHGITAVNDRALLDRLAADCVVLEVCPTSNLRTGVVRDLTEHPFSDLRAAGVLVTINSDDPMMFHTSAVAELQLVQTTWGLGHAEIEELLDTAASAACLPAVAQAARASTRTSEHAPARAEQVQR